MVRRAPPATRPTVLVVERNNSVRRLVSHLLTEQGYRVLEAGTRPAVLEHLRAATRIDVVVTDTGLALPGWEVVQEANWQRPGTPVVRLIESAADVIPVYGEDPSTMTLVLKPFLITELPASLAMGFMLSLGCPLSGGISRQVDA